MKLSIRRHSILSSTVAASLLLACSGSDGGSAGGDAAGILPGGGSAVPGAGGPADPTAPPGAGTVDPGGAGVGGPGAAGPGTTGVTDPSTLVESAGPLPLTRLSRREYDNTVRDLLGDTSQAAIAFPADTETETGFRVSATVGLLNAQLFLDTAEALATTAITSGNVVIGCDPAAIGEDACSAQFIADFGKRAFRRPVTAGESAGLQGIFAAARTLEFTFEESISHVLSAMLQSPGFLYHWEIGEVAPQTADGLVALTPYQVASRLSYLLWETMPDAELMRAADANELSTAAQVRAQAERMLQDRPRVLSAMENFHTQWLELGNLDDLQKDEAVFPEFGPELRATLPAELANFATSVIAEGDGTLRGLLTAPHAFVNASTASIYGVQATGTELQRVELNPSERAGILTQAAFLASRATLSTSHPILRGLSVFRRMFCGVLPPVPANVPEPEPASPTLTTRQRFAAHSENPCATCHVFFDGFGFAFENYDALGNFRTTENGFPVDATGTSLAPSGVALTFNNAVEMAGILADSDEVEACVTRQWARYALGRPEVAADEGSIQLALAQGRVAGELSIRDMLLSLVERTTFRFRAP